MRHRIKGKKLNRDTNHRKMLLRNLVRSLVEVGEITTTEAKAKETKRLADKYIGKAKADTVATRRVLHSFFGKRDVVNTLVERVAPLFGDRASGFTTLKKAGTRRGDNTGLVTLALVKKPEGVGTLKKVAAAVVAKKTATKVEKTVAKKAPVKKTTAKKTAKKETK